MVRALDDAVGAGNGDMLRRGGAYAAEYDISRIHRLFFRIANPAFVLEKSTEIWARFFDTGEWTIKRQKATSAEGVLTGWTITDDRSCEYLRAYIQRMFEIVGAKDVENRHVECRARGGAQCRFLIAWR